MKLPQSVVEMFPLTVMLNRISLANLSAQNIESSATRTDTRINVANGIVEDLRI